MAVVYEPIAISIELIKPILGSDPQPTRIIFVNGPDAVVTQTVRILGAVLVTYKGL
jgi:hypothetical protein